MLAVFVFAYAPESVSFAQVSRPLFIDDVPPVIHIPSKLIVAEASGPQGSIVVFNVTATDNVDGNVNALCTPSSGSTFGIGETKVVCTASDKAGNKKTESFKVKVQDTTPPSTSLRTPKVSWMGNLDNQEHTISNDIGFGFSGFDKVGVRGFECKLDNNNWQPSTVNYQTGDISGCYYIDLGPGYHTFQVRAIDTSGNKDPSPKIFSWTIMPLRDAILDLRGYIVHLNLPSNFERDLSNSLDNAINNIPNSGEYDHLICEYIDSFNYKLSRVSVLDFINQDTVDFIDNSIGAIRERTGCNPPVADPGSDKVVIEGTRNVILDGSNSFDSKDGKNLIYEWTQISGPTVNLINFDKSKSSFDAPFIGGTGDQTLVFKLEVTDRNELSSDNIVSIIIKHVPQVNPPPVAENQHKTVNPPPVAENQRITTTSDNPADITLKATDPDGDAITYAIVSDPKSGTITEFNKNTGSLVYTPNKGFTGQDKFTFKANDGSADSDTAQVIVTVTINKNQDTGLEKGADIVPKEITSQNSTNATGLFHQGFSEIMNNTESLFHK